ncbi:Microcystinase C [Pseudocercospora fuligena]|uniref:Microcystinase C n=1 Tax=Pseudocercospora fuligena TaxID=685502 RepID=A0A8H6RFG7_9PEZI|nr:Microcystinase C [Pseudocercospora fuligena]
MFKPTIAIAGLGCENSTFTPSRTNAAAFHPKRGDEILEQYKSILPSSATFIGTLSGHSLPGGIVTREAFEELSSEITTRLQKILDEGTKLDGLWFDIHGAMHIDGFDDAEAELLNRIRNVIGQEVVVSASMDLHGNVSHSLISQLDLVTCYRTAPHIDVTETKERALRNLIEVLKMKSDGKKDYLPIKAWIPVPILLPGEMTSTRDAPADRIYAAVPEVETLPGVLDAAIWVGYAWGDDARNCAIVVVTGWDEKVVRDGAEKLAELFWDARNEFKFVAPTGSLEECLDQAVKKDAKRPYYISDSGDNPTAGGSGDVTWSLDKILAREEFKREDGLKVIYASLPGPAAMKKCFEAGVGQIVTVTAGAEVDNIHHGPITMTGRVHSLREGDKWAVREAVLQVGNIFVILTEFRKPFHKENDFKNLDLDARHGADVVIVKIGYLEPDLYDMSADWMLALTPGGVDQDLKRLGHKNIARPMWPFDEKFEQEPDLSARIISRSE